jgi:hypothetical protein
MPETRLQPAQARDTGDAVPSLALFEPADPNLEGRGQDNLRRWKTGAPPFRDWRHFKRV